jgi:hypothetical protein
MPRMKQDPAMELIERVRGTFRQCGSLTSHHHAYDGLFDYVVRECSHPLSNVEGWEEPGLFVALKDFKPSKKTFVMVLYQMGDDEVVALAIPSTTNKKMTGFTTYASSPFFRSEEGRKVDIAHWVRVKLPRPALVKV